MTLQRRQLGTTLITAAVLLLTACAPTPVEGWTPAEVPAVTNESHETPVIDPASVPGLHGQRILNEGTNVAARFTYLPGRGDFNDHIDELIIDEIEAFTGGVPPRPEAHPEGTGLGDRGCVAGSTSMPAEELLADSRFGPLDSDEPGLAIVCDVAFAAGTIFAERFRFVEGSAAGVTSDRVKLVITNTATEELFTGHDLLAGEATDPLWELAVSAARRAAGAMWDTEVAPPTAELREAFEANYVDPVIEPDGSLTVTIRGGLDAPELLDLVGHESARTDFAVTLAPDSARPLLTPLGQAMQDAVLQGAAHGGPAAVRAVDEHVNCRLLPCVALTYDDGPDHRMPEILDMLAEKHAVVTFYVIGQYVPGNQAVVTRAYDQGHEIANHSWSHPDFTDLTDEELRQEIDQCTLAIIAATGEAPASLRPPYGAFDDRLRQQTNLPNILWDVDTEDWREPGPSIVIDRAVGEAEIGSIILVHVNHDGTVEATPGMVDGLRDRGFELVTISKLFNGSIPAGPVRSA